MAGQECDKDQAELWYGGTIAFPSEHKTKLVRNRSVPFRSVPFRPRLNMALAYKDLFIRKEMTIDLRAKDLLQLPKGKTVLSGLNSIVFRGSIL